MGMTARAETRQVVQIIMGGRPRANRVSEADIAFGVLVIASFQHDGIATFQRLKREIPVHVHLPPGDTGQSIMRPNEEMWVQKIRNIKIHRNVSGNFIKEGYLVHIPHVGYQITTAGFRRRMRGK